MVLSEEILERVKGNLDIFQIVKTQFDREDKETGEKTRDEVYEKWTSKLSLEYLKTANADEIKKFFNFTENQHWDGISRNTGRFLSDYDKFVRTIEYLYDDSISVQVRVDNVRNRESEYHLSWFGKAVMTPILHVSHPSQYPPYNNIVINALIKLDIITQESELGKSEGEIYENFIELATFLSQELEVDYWILDWIWWRAATNKSINVVSDAVKNTLKTFTDQISVMKFSKSYKIILLLSIIAEFRKEEIANPFQYNYNIRNNFNLFYDNLENEQGKNNLYQPLYYLAETDKLLKIEWHNEKPSQPSSDRNLFSHIESIAVSDTIINLILNEETYLELTEFLVSKASELVETIDNNNNPDYIVPSNPYSIISQTYQEISSDFKFWWVNQKKSFEKETSEGFLWAPVDNQPHHKNMKYVRPLDIVFHNNKVQVKAISQIKRLGTHSQNPHSADGNQWQNIGYKVSVDTILLENTIPLSEIPDNLKIPQNQAFRINKQAKLGYLWPLGDEVAIYLRDKYPEINKILSEFEITTPIATERTGHSYAPILNRFYQDLQTTHLSYKKEFVLRFITSLLTKPFAILTGLSGSGKTKLAQAFASWICNQDQILIIPVGADWTGNENIIGYADALEKGSYVRTKILNLLLKATEDREKPYFIILDEMNLSHVERYFSDFLSAMESGDQVHLHSSSEINDIPETLLIPENIYVIGTVNVDETTYMFSPKVLDRANVIEFHVDLHDIKRYLDYETRSVDLSTLNQKGIDLGHDFVELSSNSESLGVQNKEILDNEIINIFNILKKENAEFAYRTINEISEFIFYYKKIGGEDIYDAIDAQIIQKVLPKLNGSKKKMRPILQSLGKYCWDKNVSDGDFDPLTKTVDDIISAKYPLSFGKIRRMYKILEYNGFVSFAEA